MVIMQFLLIYLSYKKQSGDAYIFRIELKKNVFRLFYHNIFELITFHLKFIVFSLPEKKTNNNKNNFIDVLNLFNDVLNIFI